MHKKNHQTPELNNSTYQTGFTDRPKKSSGIIAVLLGLTIFLSGLASGLGILNVRLLQQLMEQPEETVPMDIYTSPSANTAPTDALQNDDSPAPEIPAERNVQLQLQTHSSRFESGSSLPAQQIYSRNAAGLVTVYCDSPGSSLSGMGVVISSQGYILTAARTVEAASRIYVTLPDGTDCRAALVGTDALTDLAVLYIERQNLTAVGFCDASELLDGDPIAAAAVLPDRDPAVLTVGFAGERISVALGSRSLELVQTTAGSYDGPVFNGCGQVIGMNSGHVSDFFDLYIQSDIGYMLPSTTVKEVVEQIIAFGFVPGRPSLGICTETISKLYQQYWDGLPGGLRLLSVNEQAQAQGLREGDILLALNGRRLTENADLHKLLLSSQMGQTLTAVVYRDGESMTLSLTIFDLAA